MQLSLEDGTRLRSRLAQGSLVSMGAGGVEDGRGGARSLGSGPAHLLHKHCREQVHRGDTHIYRKFILPTEEKNRVSLGLNIYFIITPSYFRVYECPLSIATRRGKHVVAEARYTCNVAKQQRCLTTARSKRKGAIAVPLDWVSLTACRTHGSIVSW